MDLTNLLSEGNLDLPRLSKDLDEIGHPGRIWAIRQWSKPIQARLFDALQGFRPITLDDIVPPSEAPLAQVIHDGQNTLLLFQHFQKRFCKPTGEAATERLWGYNHQPFSSFTGPGYFVAHPGTQTGEVEIDYTEVPAEKAAGWPEILPNSAKLGRFVYAGMVDVLRGLSSHVSVGRARKKGAFMDTWFVLVRREAAP